MNLVPFLVPNESSFSATCHKTRINMDQTLVLAHFNWFDDIIGI